VVGEAVDAGPQGRRDGLLVRVEVVLGVDQVGRRARVRADQQVLLGPGPQLLGQIRRDVVRAAVDQVVRRHHPGRRARLDGGAEGAQVVLVQHARADRAGGGVAVRLVVVRQPVLEDGRGAPVHRMVAAQPARVGGGDRGGEPRVLRVALLVAAPQRVAQQVHRRRPDVEADALVPGAHRAGLPGHRLADPAHQFLVPGRAQADGLREHRRRAHPGDTVQRLLAGAEGGHAEPLDGRRELVQKSDLLVEGEPRQKVVDAPRERQVRIAERRRWRRVCGHVGIPSGWSGEALSKRFDARPERGRVSRDVRASDRTSPLPGPGAGGAGKARIHPRNLGCDPCVPLGVHLTSQQLRSASTARSAPAAHPPPNPRFGSASSTEDTAADGHRRVSRCAMKG
jgi:hypothetical protein